MAMTAYLLNADALARELSQESRSERMEQRIKPTMKQAIEFAAALSGTDTSEFVSRAAFQAAMDKIQGMRRVELDADDAARFFTSLDRQPGPSDAMRQLMATYDPGMDADAD